MAAATHTVQYQINEPFRAWCACGNIEVEVDEFSKRQREQKMKLKIEKDFLFIETFDTLKCSRCMDKCWVGEVAMSCVPHCCRYQEINKGRKGNPKGGNDPKGNPKGKDGKDKGKDPKGDPKGKNKGNKKKGGNQYGGSSSSADGPTGRPILSGGSQARDYPNPPREGPY